MSDQGESGVRQSPERGKASLYDLALRVVFPIALAVGVACSSLLWAHEGRLTVLEVQSKTEMREVKEDLKEIKADVKKLLGGDK